MCQLWQRLGANFVEQRTSEVRSTLRARSRSVLCAGDAACPLVEIGGAGYCRSEYYLLLYSAFTSPANQPGLSLSEVSVSNAERMGKRSSDLAVSNLLQISATSNSLPARSSANLGDRDSRRSIRLPVPLRSAEAQQGSDRYRFRLGEGGVISRPSWPLRARRGGDPASGRGP